MNYPPDTTNYGTIDPVLFLLIGGLIFLILFFSFLPIGLKLLSIIYSLVKPHP